MFAYAYSFNQDISQWDGRISRHVMAFACRTRTLRLVFFFMSFLVSGPRDMNSMFFNAVSFNIDLSPWDGESYFTLFPTRNYHRTAQKPRQKK